MVDRFHDDLDRKPIVRKERSAGYGNDEQLKHICGGTINGITKHLDYISGL